MDDYRAYELDIKRTLISNIFGIIFLFVVLIFIIFSTHYISELEKNQQIMGLIIFMFSTIQILSFLHPNFEYKLKDEYKNQLNKKEGKQI